jgi:hypothetical protein
MNAVELLKQVEALPAREREKFVLALLKLAPSAKFRLQLTCLASAGLAWWQLLA